MVIRPSILIMAMMSESAYNGDKNLNPFSFKHFGLEKAIKHIENVSVWTNGLTFDWDRGHYL